MDEMLSYIFHNMNTSEKTLRRIAKMLSMQKTHNRTVNMWASLITGYLFLNELRTMRQDQQIQELKRELEELKGEQGMND